MECIEPFIHSAWFIDSCTSQPASQPANQPNINTLQFTMYFLIILCRNSMLKYFTYFVHYSGPVPIIESQFTFKFIIFEATQLSRCGVELSLLRCTQPSVNRFNFIFFGSSASLVTCWNAERCPAYIDSAFSRHICVRNGAVDLNNNNLSTSITRLQNGFGHK